ncbi:MAG: DUF2726 domain-containing protein [Gammaproteobacteria bacterium]|nr:DUF2726 domain-containing protein [Gammaproteobacteria bacterium]
MVWIIILLVLVLVLALAIKYVLPKITGKQEEKQYRTVNALFSPAEKEFLASLEAAVHNKHRIFGKVRVADVITPVHRKGTLGWQLAFKQVKDKQFNFVLCDPADLHIIAVVELDDTSLSLNERRKRDRFLIEACQDAELPLIRFPEQDKYDVEAIRERLADALWAEQLAEPTIGKKLCPKCGQALERITGSEGALAGKSFWRCTRYPECRTVIPIVP